MNKFHQYIHFKNFWIFKLKLSHDEFVSLNLIFRHDHKVNSENFAKFKHFSYQWHDSIRNENLWKIINTSCNKKNYNVSRRKKTKIIWYYCHAITLISISYILLTIFFKRSYSIIVCWFIRKISLHKTEINIWFHRCVLFNTM